MVLSRNYPELIRLSPAGREQSTCDFPAMAQSRAFVNDFLDNTPRFYAYAEGVMQGQQDKRLQLKTALEKELALPAARQVKAQIDAALE